MSVPHGGARDAIRAALQQVIGDKYEVLQWIGGGGMAEVFLARHRAHGGLFAVKVLAEQLAGEPQIVARFTAEARTAAKLGGHPNIAGVFDIGEGSGLHYLIMPYVEGEDLKSYLERHGRLTNVEALQIVRQVADALVWAGDRNVVHRDLKPSNIRMDRSGRAIVLDFGIAKAGDVPTALTRTGETLGTPYYMSPEQFRSEPCDARSDLYSLGVILFELLSGTKPFAGDSLWAIQLGHLQGVPPALSSLVSGVDPKLEQVVNRLLEKAPAERYQSARELLADLGTVREGTTAVHLNPHVEGPNIASETGLGSPSATGILNPRVDRLDVASEAPSGQERGAAGVNERTGEDRTPVSPGAPHSELRRKKRTHAWLISTLLAALAVVAGGVWLATHGGRGGHKRETQSSPDKGISSTSILAETLNDSSGPMFLVPAGKFIFGSDDSESPNKRQELQLPAFYVDATEVSNEQYARFVRATGYRSPKSDTFAKAPALPVAGVTLEDAKAYCSWAGRRVPTEQEWEKAGRGVSGNIYPWGNQPLPNPGKIVAVDEYPERQSPFRALNMSGNVFEWTVSEFPVTQREIDDMKKLTGEVEVSGRWYSIKGGSFLLKDERFFRLYMRRGWPVNQVSPLIGFRCVKDAK
jgi:serine/threonine protein kinase